MWSALQTAYRAPPLRKKKGALLRFFLRGVGSVHRPSALWKRNARPVTVFFVVCSMLFTWYKPPCCTESRRCTGTRHKAKETAFSKWCQPFVSCLVSVRPFFPTWRFFATWITTARDKSSWRTCLKHVLLSTISFIYYFILFKRRKSPHPRINVVCGKRKTWGSKKQHWLLGEGRG